MEQIKENLREIFFLNVPTMCQENLARHKVLKLRSVMDYKVSSTGKMKARLAKLFKFLSPSMLNLPLKKFGKLSAKEKETFTPSPRYTEILIMGVADDEIFLFTTYKARGCITLFINEILKSPSFTTRFSW